MSTSTLSLRSSQSISSSNLGLSSGDDLPGSSERDRRSPDVRVVTPISSTMILADTAHMVGDAGLGNNHDELSPALAEGDSVRKLQLTDSTASNESCATATTSRSVSNPSSSGSQSQFRARPAPPTTNMEGLGPRLTKSAALRQGLKWEDPRDIRRMTGEGEVPVAFDDVPGHKRNLALNVASLARPSVAPRQNRAALLRLGQVPEENVKADSAELRAEMAARNKAREYQERLEKRKQVQKPASLMLPPEIAPRQNRAAMLRKGQTPTEQTPMRTAREMAEAAARNKARDAAERAERRKSVALPASLGTPQIAPRSNRASILRTGGDQPPTPAKQNVRQSTTGAARKGSHGSNNASVSSNSTTGTAGAGNQPVSILRPSTQANTQGPPPPRPARSHARTQPEPSAGAAASSTSSSDVPAIKVASDKPAAIIAADPGPSSAETRSAGDKVARRISINPVQSASTPQNAAPSVNRSSILRHGVTHSTAPSSYHDPRAYIKAPTPVPMARGGSHDSQVSSSSSVSIGVISAPTSTKSASVPSDKAVHSPSLNASRPRPVSTIIRSGPSSAAAYAQEMKEKRMSQVMTAHAPIEGLGIDQLDEHIRRHLPPDIRTCGPDPPNDRYIAPRPAPAPPANVLSHRQSLFVSAALGSSSGSSSGGTSPISDDGASKMHSPPLTTSVSGGSLSLSASASSPPPSERKQLRMRHSASMLVNRLLPMNNGSRTSLLGGKVTKVSSRV